MSRERISGLIQEAAARLGYTVYESGVLLKGENSKIIVKIDRPAGISHLDCEKFSRELAGMLEGEEALPNYSLEVSSPGLNRRLRDAGEFGRFPGAPVKIVYDDGAVRKVAKGAIGDVNEAGVTVTDEKGDTIIAYDTIVSANLDY